jgi:hypothetical protein
MHMPNPNHIDRTGRPSGDRAVPTVRSQRELVAASLLKVPVPRLRWDERTRCEYPTL